MAPDEVAAVEPQPVLDPPGTKYTATGQVADIYEDGSVVVEFPALGGGAVGIRLLAPVGTRRGDSIDRECTVLSATARALTVEFRNNAGERQAFAIVPGHQRLKKV